MISDSKKAAHVTEIQPLPLPAPPDLVIFDCDGVLVDTETISNTMLAEDLTAHGYPITAEDAFAQFVGGSLMTVRERVMAEGVTLPVTWVDQFYAKLYARLSEGVDPMPGIYGLLDTLDGHRIPYCVASNGSETKMHITLGHADLLSRFEGRMYSAHTVGVSKPDPGLFLHAARAVSVGPHRAVVIEDSVAGATAALGAGIACLGLAPHDDGAALRNVGARVIRHLSSVPDMLLLA